ncbi:UPF0149 family protein [Parashewanella tropica]|uniref:UPF0149 family protein n=1 Tax=Parashewanella tropica TaxID=2547970 RepID=UPI00105A07C6|nr:UPF0149 family protein [Parashewanella tropica]
MVTTPSLRIEKLSQALKAAELAQHPAEVHGTLVGLICGGVEHKAKAWVTPMQDLISDGQPFPAELHSLIEDLYKDTLERLEEFEFGFTLLLPEEEESLNVRVEALSLWVQSYLAAIAIIQPKLKQASAEVKEVIEDLTEIAQVELDVSDDDESEAAFIELEEFVRVSAILCYAEFTPELPKKSDEQPDILH